MELVRGTGNECSGVSGPLLGDEKLLQLCGESGRTTLNALNHTEVQPSKT